MISMNVYTTRICTIFICAQFLIPVIFTYRLYFVAVNIIFHTQHDTLLCAKFEDVKSNV